MEDSLRKWISYVEMEDEQEFLRDLLQQPDFSPENEGSTPYPCSEIQNKSVGRIVEGGGANSPTNSNLSFDETRFDGNGGTHKSNSSNSIVTLERSACSPVTYLLSFDNSTVERVINETYSPKHNSALGSRKGTNGKDGFEFEPSVCQAKTRVRRASDTQGHIMAERKRRLELTQSIIALSATIPGLKKMDKAYVLREAINYTKQLQERVKELENQNKDRRVYSAMFMKESQASSNKSTTYCETKTESPLEVHARVLEKEILIGIHCEKQKDIVPKIHALLENLHLSVTSSSVLPFGTSTLVINIISQMDEQYSMTMDDLVKNLREYLLTCNSDTF